MNAAMPSTRRFVGRMKTPLQQVRRGAILLVVVVVAAICGYKLITGSTWIDSIYMIAITISTVGYTEGSDWDWEVKLFIIVVIVFGMTTAGYTIGGFIQMVAEGEIERAVGMRHKTREIARLRGHVIICGFGRMGADSRRRTQATRRLYVSDRPRP